MNFRRNWPEIRCLSMSVPGLPSPRVDRIEGMRISAVALLALVSLPLHAQTPVKLKVDATDAPRRLFHVQISMPAKPGAMTLLYPEWIPGEHGPTGPIANLVGLKRSEEHTSELQSLRHLVCR